MGNIVHKGKVHPEPINVVTAQEVQSDGVVNEIRETFLEACMFPLNPSEDVAGQYIWINVNVRDPLFIQYQENGFKISTNDKDLTLGPVWLKKKRK